MIMNILWHTILQYDVPALCGCYKNAYLILTDEILNFQQRGNLAYSCGLLVTRQTLSRQLINAAIGNAIYAGCHRLQILLNISIREFVD